MELIDVMSVQSKSGQTTKMRAFIKDCLQQIPEVIFYEKKGNIYATRGVVTGEDKYPCVVAHTDTVHEIKEHYKVLMNEGCMYAMQSGIQAGIGGDDKVGIYTALRMLEEFPVMKAAFFRDEEIGCVGSGMAHAKFFENVGYVLQADRRGVGDVTDVIGGTKMITDEFKEIIKPIMDSYKRTYVNGLITDVGMLARKFPVCMFNASCGYFNPHTNSEFIVPAYVEYNLEFFKDCVKLLGNKLHACVRPKPTYSYNGWADDDYSGWDGHIQKGFSSFDKRFERRMRRKRFSVMKRFNLGGYRAMHLWCEIKDGDKVESRKFLYANQFNYYINDEYVGYGDMEFYEAVMAWHNLHGDKDGTVKERKETPLLDEKKPEPIPTCGICQRDLKQEDDVTEESLYCAHCMMYDWEIEQELSKSKKGGKSKT